MAYGGYGKNSPPYESTDRPYQPTPKTPEPEHGETSLSTCIAGSDGQIAAAGSPKQSEHCSGCGKSVQADFIVCPYCRHDLVTAREARKHISCKCGTARVIGAAHCHRCGIRHA